MSTIAERLDALIARLGIAERELARRSQLSEPHIGILRKKLREDPGAVQLGTLRKIAQGAGVSFAWLVLDEEVSVSQPPEYQSRLDAAQAARKEGVWEPAILAVLAEPVQPEDASRSATWWKLRMGMKEEELLDDAASRRERRAIRAAAHASGEDRLKKAQ